jgi:small subunit ribosomal protein S11
MAKEKTKKDKAKKAEKPKKEVSTAKAATRKKKSKKRDVTKGRVYIKSTFNNTVITVTDKKGEVLAWSSGGVIGNTGTRKSTPFAAAQAMRDVIEKAKKFGLREVDVHVTGPGPGKETAVKALGTTGLRVLTLNDSTRFPHNGCRPKKAKR